MKPYESRLYGAVCEKSLHAFVFGIKGEKFLYTKDEHDHANPIKPFPDVKYLRVLLDLFLVTGGIIAPTEAVYALEWGLSLSDLEHGSQTRILAIEKSRQLMVTWIVLAYILWRAKYFAHQRIMVQSKKGEDGNALVCNRRGDTNARLGVLEVNLPPFLQVPVVSLKGEMTFVQTGSIIEAIPEGGEKIRSHTPSLYFSDESAFQPQFAEAYKAALPAINGGGQGIIVSSAEIGEFQRLVGSDRESAYDIENAQDPIIDGAMRSGLTTRVEKSSGLLVCRLHYSADPLKNPKTPRGAKWLQQASRIYPGGVSGPAWRKENEIEYSAGGGEFVFPSLRRWRSDSAIFSIGDLQIVPGQARIWASYDHGYTNPCCYLVHAVYPRDNEVWYQTLWELYASGLHVREIAEIIKGKGITSTDGRNFEGNPYAGQEVTRVCDPSMDRRSEQGTGEIKRVIELFSNENVVFTKGEKGDDVTVADYILGTLWEDPQRPKYQIAPRCEHLIWELMHLQHRRTSSLYQNAPEGLVDKDNHAWDALKYFLKRFPMGVQQTQTNVIGGSFDWWRKISQMPSREAVRSSYRRVGSGRA